MARRFRFGICTDQNMTWDKNVERWQLFERLGFESAWLCDHLVQPSRPHGPYFEAWSLLGGLAARTEKIRIGVLVTSNTFRHPAVLAKMAVTVDHISRGRLEVGLGAGWYEPEHTMFGIPFPETKELVARFREAVQVIDLLMREDTSSFAGSYYQLKNGQSRPHSIQKPRPPLVLGAFGPRMLKIVATYADTWNAFGTPKEMRERNQMLDNYCGEIGRDPDTLDRSLYYWVPKADADPWASKKAFYDVINPYIDAGVNQFILDQPRDDQLEMLEWASAEALPRFAHEAPRTVEPAAAAEIDTSVWKRPQDHL
jgi:alkanesulfonate monooxygenase SsuD/methylene tetrahydromethanopterin reductase-like flavin-dependent oxidoreductase (luciferase family)